MSVMDSLVDIAVRYGFRVLGAAIILGVGGMTARWLGRLVEQWLVRPTVDLEPPIRMLIVRLVKILVLVVTLLIVLQQVGVEITPLIAGLGVAGLGISFALQGVLSNVMAGLTIIFTKPYRVGEYIRIVGEEGYVDKIDIFTTTVTHVDRSRVVIPNRKIVGEILHNYGTVRQLEIHVGVAYQTDLARALGVVENVLAANAKVLREPKAVVGVQALGESAVEILVAPWTSVLEYGDTHRQLTRGLLEAFRTQGIDIPFPQREVRMLPTTDGINSGP